MFMMANDPGMDTSLTLPSPTTMTTELYHTVNLAAMCMPQTHAMCLVLNMSITKFCIGRNYTKNKISG